MSIDFVSLVNSNTSLSLSDNFKLKLIDELKEQLNMMYKASSTQHAEMAKKIGDLEKIRQKTMWMVAGAVAAFGILSGHVDKILAFFH